MVYDKSGKSGQKKERKVAQGKLVSISSDSTKCELYDEKEGKFTWVNIAIVNEEEKVKDSEGNEKEKWYNISAFEIDFSKMPELQKADTLLREGRKPMVEVEHYEVERNWLDENGQPVIEEVETEKDGKTIIREREKKFTSLRCSADDIIKTFKVLDEGEEPKQEEENKVEVQEEKVK